MGKAQISTTEPLVIYNYLHNPGCCISLSMRRNWMVNGFTNSVRPFCEIYLDSNLYVELPELLNRCGKVGSERLMLDEKCSNLYCRSLGDLQLLAPPGLLYQPLSMKRSWMVNGFTNSIRPFCEISLIPNASQYRQNRGKMNGHIPVTDVPHWKQSDQSLASSKQSSNPQQARLVKYAPTGRFCGMNKGFGVSSAVGSFSEGSENLSTMLTSAPPKQQKRTLGEHLYPLVSQHKPNLASQFTRMPMEMDNSELLPLLKSPDGSYGLKASGKKKLYNNLLPFAVV